MKKRVHMLKCLALYLLLNNFTLAISQKIYTIDILSKEPLILCNARKCSVLVQMRTNFMPSSTWSRTFTNKTVQVLGNSIPTKYTAGTTTFPQGCQPQLNVYCNITITLVINEVNENDFGGYEGTFGSTDKDEVTITFCIPNTQRCAPERFNTEFGISTGDGNNTGSGNNITITVNSIYLIIGAAVIIALTLIVVILVLILKHKARKQRSGNESSKNKNLDCSNHETSHMYDEIPSIGYEDMPERPRQNSHQYTVPVTEGTSTYNDPAKVNPKPAPTRYIRRDTQGYLEPSVLPTENTKSCVGNPTYIENEFTAVFSKRKKMINDFSINEKEQHWINTTNKQRSKEPVQPTYSNPLPGTDSSTKLHSKESLRLLRSNPIYQEDKTEPSAVNPQREPLVKKSSNHLKVPSSRGHGSFRSPSTSSNGNESKLVKTGSQKRVKETNYENASLGKNGSVYINVVSR